MITKDDQLARKEAGDIRTNVGWYKFTHNLMEVTGADAGRFLDFMSANPIANLAPGQSRYTTILGEDGGILDDVIIIHPADNLYWVSTLDYASLAAWFDGYQSGFAVSYREATSEIDMYAIQGPNSLKMVEMVAAQPVGALAYFAIAANQVGALSVHILRAGFTGELGYEIYVANSDAAALEQALAEACAELGGSNTTSWDVIVRGIPAEKGYVLPADILGLTPYEIGAKVNPSRDFVGQAALAAAGPVPSKLLLGLDFADAPAAEGDAVFAAGVEAGKITCVTYSFVLERFIGYAILDIAVAPVGTVVTAGADAVAATVVERIWYDPSDSRVRG